MQEPKPPARAPCISVVPFGDLPAVFGSKPSRQLHYLFDYLRELGARAIVIEEAYFDRDYLAEFAAFYSISASGYVNVCRRLHFFEEPQLTERELQQALGGDPVAQERMQKNYLGFVVQRPLSHAPLGRTALKWYPDLRQKTPRITNPSRTYYIHLAGLRLSVDAVAWQQQDSGVGSCATVGMWSLLHSSALDEFHAIPTTVDITLSGSSLTNKGRHAFPAIGLTNEQLCEVIKAQKLAPLLLEGDLVNATGDRVGFTRRRFAAALAWLIRSGYPVLIDGNLAGKGRHAVCAVGFREVASRFRRGAPVILQDEQTEYFFLHDDNIGPNVRFKLTGHVQKIGTTRVEQAILSPEAPARRFKSERRSATENYPHFVPYSLLAAAHPEIRSSVEELISSVIDIAEAFQGLAAIQDPTFKWLASSGRLMRLSDYMGDELARTLGPGARLVKARLALSDVPAMSLFVAVGRIGLRNSTALVDVLYDTTDCKLKHSMVACVSYNSFSTRVLEQLFAWSTGPSRVPIVQAY